MTEQACELRSEPELATAGRAATSKTDAMRHLAAKWTTEADEKISGYLNHGIAWMAADYLLLAATASAAAGGAALSGSPRAAAVLAFVAAGAAAGSGPAAREVARLRTKKVAGANSKASSRSSSKSGSTTRRTARLTPHSRAWRSRSRRRRPPAAETDTSVVPAV